MTPQTRDRTESARHPLWAENETLRKQTARLTVRLTQAELIINVPKKLTTPGHPDGEARGRRARLKTATRSLSTETDRKPAGDAFGLVWSWFYRGQGQQKAFHASEPIADLIVRGAAGDPPAPAS